MGNVEFNSVNAVTIEFTASAVDSVNATTFTFSSQSLGTVASDRKIVVNVSGGEGGVFTVSSVTVAGNSATQVVTSTLDGETINDLWQVDVPTGSTGDVVVTWSGSKGNCGIGVYAVFGAAASATDTGTSNANPGTDTLNIPANGVAIAGYTLVGVGNNDRTTTWTNLNENYDETQESAGGVTQTGAHSTFSNEQVALAITGTPSGTTLTEAMSMASWGPA